MDIFPYMEQRRLLVERHLQQVLNPRHSVAPRLAEAMHYAVFAGGKRLRPLLACAAAETLGAAPEAALAPACALELIHTYSLVHDDLPAMDDDRLRRGKATCHIRFDEATAILAGDALQARAFELLATSPSLAVGDRTRLQLIALLSQASGPAGMVAGQSIDIEAVGTLQDEQSLAQMHRLKTGALIRASVLMGALSSNVASSADLTRLGEVADRLGLAFQIHDDILDVSSDTGTLGKQQGRDEALAKPTYVSLLGVSGAQRRCSDLLAQAQTLLAHYGEASQGLRSLADYIGQRRH